MDIVKANKRLPRPGDGQHNDYARIMQVIRLDSKYIICDYIGCVVVVCPA